MGIRKIENKACATFGFFVQSEIRFIPNAFRKINDIKAFSKFIYLFKFVHKYALLFKYKPWMIAFRENCLHKQHQAFRQNKEYAIHIHVCHQPLSKPQTQGFCDIASRALNSHGNNRLFQCTLAVPAPTDRASHESFSVEKWMIMNGLVTASSLNKYGTLIAVAVKYL